MIKSLYKLFSCSLCLLFLYSCMGTKEFIPIHDKSKSYQVYNISYNIPKEGDWFFGYQSDYKVVLTSGKDNSYETYAAKIEIIYNDKQFSDDEAYELIKSRFLSEEKTKYRDRYNIIDSSTSKSIEKDTFCIRLYSKARDHKPSKKPRNVDFLILETLERVCRHPKDPSKFVIIGFSQRSSPNNTTTGFLERAEDFFGNIQF